MALSRERFASELSREIRARRSFGGHPFWQKIEQGSASRSALQTFAKQFYLQVFAFPRAVSALHSRCADAEERIRLAESLYEEETGRISVAAFGDLLQGLSSADVTERINRHFGLHRPSLMHIEEFPADIPLATDAPAKSGERVDHS